MDTETFIKTDNYTEMYELVSTLTDDLGGSISSKANAERMGLCYGKFGVGKTLALEKLSVEFNAILLRQNQSWTKTSVRGKIAEELGISTKGKNGNAIYEEIVDSLLYNPKPIIIDEIDGLLIGGRFEIMELFRDIHDETRNVFIFTGMETCNARLKNHPHFYSRIVEKRKMKNMGKNDVTQFCKLSDIVIEEDLVEYFVKKYPNLRIIKVLILRLEKWAEISGVEKVNYKLFKQSKVEKDDE